MFNNARPWVTLGLLAGLSVVGGKNANAADLSPGLSASVDFAQDYFRDVSGGIEKGSGAPSAIHLTGDLDSRYWGGNGNDRFHIDFLGTGGSSISNRVGDLQGLDNIEATNTARLFAAWYEHAFAGTGSSVRVGVQDYNALFDTLDTASLFINSSPGLDPTISQIGISTFPETTWGAVYQWHGQNGLYAQGGVYDGTPGLSGHPYGTHLEIRSGDGAFSAVEAGITGSGDNSYKLGVGAWYDTQHYTDPAGLHRHKNQGGYLIGERVFSAVASVLPWTTGIYFQAGVANASRNIIDHYLGTGVTLTGVIPQRPDDQLGLSIDRAHTSSTYRHATADSTAAETAIELTYQAVVKSYLTVQPDVQYIMDPGASASVSNAWVVGARFDLSW